MTSNKTLDSAFDFAIVVVNLGVGRAELSVTGPNGFDAKFSLASGGLKTIYLPWVDALRGKEGDPASEKSIIVKRGAYNLVSSSPIVAYQFNPIEFEGKAGPPGKNWDNCTHRPLPGPCLSVTNDASLLLPTAALTGSYRVGGIYGMQKSPPFVAITATEDGTAVEVQLPPQANIAGDEAGAVRAARGGSTVSLSLDRGDVAQLRAVEGGEPPTVDFGGALVVATKPVHVISGTDCSRLPHYLAACDHLEETVPPVESLGMHYVVAAPSAAGGYERRHMVRFFGNFDRTQLTYLPARPEGCPATLDAGEVAQCMAGNDALVVQDFEVSGDHSFLVASYTIGSEAVHLGPNLGDPSQTFVVPVEQYQGSYIFLAPPNYTESYVDVIAPRGTDLLLDGRSVPAEARAPVSDAFDVARLPLLNSISGAHSIRASQPVGIQVMGYGRATSYLYPGGGSLELIGPAPRLR